MKGILLALAASVAGGVASAVEVDGIAARVGSEAILRSEVYNEMRHQGAHDESRYGEVCNQLIDRKLVLQAAQKSKMTLQDWVVENRVREIVNKSFGGDRSKLMEMLGKQKVSYPEWYARTKEDMLIGAMRWNVIDKNVIASPAAMREEFERHRGRYVKDHRVTVTVILLKPSEKERRAEILEALKSKTFEELGGRKYADVKPEEMFKPDVVASIEKMAKGAVSDWIEIDGWSFLLRKDAETSGKSLSFEEAYAEVEAQVKETAADRLYDEWIERLRAETYVKVF